MSEPLDLDAIERRWSADGCMGNPRSADDYTEAGCRVFAQYAFDEVPALVARVRDLEPRVLEGGWETVRDALDALPEGAQIRWRTGMANRPELAIHRGPYWHSTNGPRPIDSDNIARDETPIEVIA